MTEYGDVQYLGDYKDIIWLLYSQVSNFGLRLPEVGLQVETRFAGEVMDESRAERS
jgi:hypothetical protein